MAYIIGKSCVDCMDTACASVCPVDCILVDPNYAETNLQLKHKYDELVKK